MGSNSLKVSPAILLPNILLASTDLANENQNLEKEANLCIYM